MEIKLPLKTGGFLYEKCYITQRNLFFKEKRLQSRTCPSVIFLTENATGPGSRFLPFGALCTSNKNIAPPFKPPRRQSSLPASPQKLKNHLEKNGTWSLVALLTCGARDPASRCSPFSSFKLA